MTVLFGLAIVVTACGVPAGDSLGGPADNGQAADSATTKDKAVDGTTSAKESTVSAIKSGPEEEKTADCPVTIPGEPGLDPIEPKGVTYSKAFPAPDPWPADYPHSEMVWYGTQELWTALSIDGNHSPRKSVWWSASFPGGIKEEQPQVTVIWTRLDTKEPTVIHNGDQATNAYTPEEGWFMIAGGDPDEPGCWRVKATYKGATLSYVYETAK